MSFIELKNVSYVYNEDEEDSVTAVDDISLAIAKGEFVALVGHNGSGKSTVAKLLNGLLMPSAGEVLVNGMTTKDKKNWFDIRKTVGVVFQNPDNQMIATIIEDDIAFGPENLGLPSKEIVKRVEWALKAVGMYEHRSGTPFRLSGGQKQRVAIAGILAMRPDAIVLDESTAMLDPVGRKEVLAVMRSLNREYGMTVVMITHYMDEAVDADRIIVMDGGKIAMSGGKEILLCRDELQSLGLTVPMATSISCRLSEVGLPIERVVDNESLLEAICRLL